MASIIILPAVVESRLTAKHPPLVAGPGCTPTREDIFRLAQEGSYFLGCVKTTTQADAADLSSEQAAQPPPPFKLRAADLVQNASETFLLQQHTLVKGKANYYYIKAIKTTWTTLRDTGMALPSVFPGAMNRTAPGALMRGNGTGVAVVKKSAIQPGHRRALQQTNDNRFRPSSTTDYPFYPIGKLTFRMSSGTSWCSASFISPDDLLTAAHCVIDSETGEAYTDFRFAPGKDGDWEPYGR